jgi:CheY-like chemotaxis protein
VGTAFTVRLPREVGERREPEPPRERVPAVAGTAGTVLVIDDDPAARQLLSRMLQKEGFQVLEASGGEEGIELARVQRPDVITLDVLMPGLDGWGVLAVLKSETALATIPVVMVTITDDRQLGFSLGAVEYLSKPIDRARLGAVVARYRREPAAGAGADVLVVEDDPPTRAMLRRTLEKEGWSVREAANGRAGLEQVSAESPALILLDLMMPEMDGFEFRDGLRRHAATAPPVVVITAKELTEQDRQRLNGGVRAVVQKRPQDFDGLLAEVRSRIPQHAG